MRRYASSNKLSPDDAIMKEAGDAARDAILAINGSTYESNNGFILGIV